MCSVLGPSPMCYTRPLINDLTSNARRILCSALTVSTRKMYLHAWCRYDEFCSSNLHKAQIPISVVQLVNYLSSMYEKGYRPSTIVSHVSALSYIQKMFGFSDLSSAF